MTEQGLQSIYAAGTDPYANLAFERALMENVPGGHVILYLWQNEKTVVIGRNQNAWTECDTQKLIAEGGRLARRLSGGGAVFHDLGNLNFTFLANDADYDLDRQLEVIIRAVAAFGITAERTGRNDIEACGRKFSGNAFYSSKGKRCHHGTLLVDADMDMLGRYLNVPLYKLRSKGVSSVRSRVANLKSLCGGITIEALSAELVRAFSNVYGAPCDTFTPPCDILRLAEAYRCEFSSHEWLFGRKATFPLKLEKGFPWGHFALWLDISDGQIKECIAYSDSLETGFIDGIAFYLKGCFYNAADVCSALRVHAHTAADSDIIDFLESEIKHGF